MFNHRNFYKERYDHFKFCQTKEIIFTPQS